MPQETETLLSQRFSEDIYNLLSGINGLDDDSTITNKMSEVMVFDGDVFCSWSDFGLFATVMQLSLSSQTVQRKTMKAALQLRKPKVHSKNKTHRHQIPSLQTFC